MTKEQALAMLKTISNCIGSGDTHILVGTFIVPVNSLVLIEAYVGSAEKWGIQVVFKDGTSNMVRQFVGDV